MKAVYFDPQSDYCISDQGRRDMLENLEVYRAALDRCNATIEENNEVIE